MGIATVYSCSWDWSQAHFVIVLTESFMGLNKNKKKKKSGFEQETRVSCDKIFVFDYLCISYSFLKCLQLAYLQDYDPNRHTVGRFGNYFWKALLPTALTLSLFVVLCVKWWKEGPGITWQLPRDVLISVVLCGNQHLEKTQLGLHLPKTFSSCTNTISSHPDFIQNLVREHSSVTQEQRKRNKQISRLLRSTVQEQSGSSDKRF